MLRRSALLLKEQAEQAAKRNVVVTARVAGDVSPSDGGTTSSGSPSDNMETMMPWQGWVYRLLKRTLGDEKFEKLRSIALFRSDDPHGLVGVPEHARTTVKGVPRIKGFRYPAPGSRPPVTVPTADLGSDPYNNNYYGRDTRRNAKPPIYHIVGSDVSAEERSRLPGTVKLISAEGEDGKAGESVELLVSPEPEKIGSPGNKGMFATGKSDYDPSGLRCVRARIIFAQSSPRHPRLWLYLLLVVAVVAAAVLLLLLLL